MFQVLFNTVCFLPYAQNPSSLSHTHFMYNLYQNQNHFQVLASDKSEYTKITGNPFLLQEYNLYYTIV